MTISELFELVPMVEAKIYSDVPMYEISMLEDYFMFTIDEYMEEPNNFKTLLELDMIASLIYDEATYKLLLENVKRKDFIPMDFVTYLRICNPVLFYLIKDKAYCEVHTLCAYVSYIDDEFRKEYLERVQQFAPKNELSKLVIKQLKELV